MPEYFDRYINLVEDGEVLEILEHYGIQWLEGYRDVFVRLGDSVYAPGKWTIRDILRHLIDTERIFVYRALAFARGDKTLQPGFDEDLYAASAHESLGTLDELFEEFAVVRSATISFYKTLNSDMLQCEGIAFQKNISVLAIGFLIAGHALHHCGVIRERYYPLLTNQ